MLIHWVGPVDLVEGPADWRDEDLYCKSHGVKFGHLIMSGSSTGATEIDLGECERGRYLNSSAVQSWLRPRTRAKAHEFHRQVTRRKGVVGSVTRVWLEVIV